MVTSTSYTLTPGVAIMLLLPGTRNVTSQRLNYKIWSAEILRIQDYKNTRSAGCFEILKTSHTRFCSQSLLFKNLKLSSFPPPNHNSINTYQSTVTESKHHHANSAKTRIKWSKIKVRTLTYHPKWAWTMQTFPLTNSDTGWTPCQLLDPRPHVFRHSDRVAVAEFAENRRHLQERFAYIPHHNYIS